MFTISKQFHFSASHQLKRLPASHPCARLHGHNYIVEVELQSEMLNDTGFVRDYTELNDLKQMIAERLDHQHLNEVLGDDCITAEQLARWLYQWCKDHWPEVTAVRISETPKTWAEFRP
jgi:6-pyruvoyltetrahydropterin/6-carboxytetrahydropterin synthase